MVVERGRPPATSPNWLADQTGMAVGLAGPWRSPLPDERTGWLYLIAGRPYGIVSGLNDAELQQFANLLPDQGGNKVARQSSR